jgi:hypothetical protein
MLIKISYATGKPSPVDLSSRRTKATEIMAEKRHGDVRPCKTSRVRPLGTLLGTLKMRCYGKKMAVNLQLLKYATLTPGGSSLVPLEWLG